MSLTGSRWFSSDVFDYNSITSALTATLEDEKGSPYSKLQQFLKDQTLLNMLLDQRKQVQPFQMHVMVPINPFLLHGLPQAGATLSCSA